VIDADLAQLSAAIYAATWPEVEAQMPEGWHIVLPFDKGPCEAMLCRNGIKAVALIFRGTEVSRFSIRDVLSNTGPMSYWDGKGSVHAGYWRYVNYVKESALGYASILAGAPFYVSGHSMGGAAASLWGGACENRIKIDAIVTFGSPKCMNEEAAKSVKTPIRRYVIRNDPAQHWPPNPWLLAPGELITLEMRGNPLQKHNIDNYCIAVRKHHADDQKG